MNSTKVQLQVKYGTHLELFKEIDLPEAILSRESIPLSLPFAEDTNNDLIFKITRYVPGSNKADLVCDKTDWKPSERITTEEDLNHFLSSVANNGWNCSNKELFSEHLKSEESKLLRLRKAKEDNQKQAAFNAAYPFSKQNLLFDIFFFGIYLVISYAVVNFFSWFELPLPFLFSVCVLSMSMKKLLDYRKFRKDFPVT